MSGEGAASNQGPPERNNNDNGYFQMSVFHFSVCVE